MTDEMKRDIKRLIKNSRDAIVGSIDDEGMPNAKMMFVYTNDEPGIFWFSTNTSSIRVGQFQKRPQACVYFSDAKGFYGLMITGTMEVRLDAATKKAFWKLGDRMYYPKGVTDPDYCILRFAAEKCSYYHNLIKERFPYRELL